MNIRITDMLRAVLIAVLAVVVLISTQSCSHNSVSKVKPTPSSAVTEQQQTLALQTMLEAVYQRRLQADPVLASRVGRQISDKPWFDLSLAGWDREYEETKQDLAALRAGVDVDALDAAGRVNYRAFEVELQLRLKRYRWRYHLNPINQIVGPHLTIAGTLLNSHPIDSEASAQYYIERLRSVPVPMEQLIEHLGARRELGIRIPAAVLARLVDGAQSILVDKGNGNVILKDFETKLAGIKLNDEQRTDYLAKTKEAYQQGFVSGYQSLIESLQQSRESVVNQGVWAMPDGEQFYEFLIDQYTTANFSAAQIHELGLAEVERIHSEMDAIRQRVNFAGDLFAFFEHLKTAPQFYLPNTDEGRDDYLLLAQGLVDKAKASLSLVLPYALPYPLQVRRIEVFREKSAPIGFYESGSADNGYVGTIFLGMYDMSSLATYDLPALLFHEGLPGHHLQSAVMQSREIPAIRKYYIWWSNTAFTEGWALYAESLADELGLYQDDYAQFGRLAGELWRACRLVVDSGLHLKQWARDEAIEYLNSNTASSAENNARAVDRYLAVPGQATAFKVGMQAILDLRTATEQRLGNRFNLAAFHALLLANGPLPITLLREEAVAWDGVDISTVEP